MNALFLKGVACGFLVTLLNIALVVIGVKLIVRPGGTSGAHIVLYLLRYVIFALLTVLFLKLRIGAPLGYLAGISAGFLVFLVLERNGVLHP